MKRKTGSDQYLMEREDEGKRLHINRSADQLLEHLESTGILSLPSSPVLVDAGSGSGFVSKIVMEMLKNVQQRYELYLLDFSKARLDEAKQILWEGNQGRSKFIQTNLENIPLRSNRVDFIYSTFVFEFLYNPQACFKELLRVLKPGGKFVIIDLDYNCLTHYPMPEILERQMAEIARTLFEMKLFDVNVGRKIYNWFYTNSLRDIKVRVSAHHLFYGDLPSSDKYNWTTKLDQLAELQNNGMVNFSFSVKEFKEEFLELLTLPSRFSYTPCILVEGTK